MRSRKGSQPFWTKKHFCIQCGAQIKASVRHVGFDDETGGKLYRLRFTCSGYRWYTFWRHSDWYCASRAGFILFTEKERQDLIATGVLEASED